MFPAPFLPTAGVSRAQFIVFSLLSPGLPRGRAGKGLGMLLASASPQYTGVCQGVPPSNRPVLCLRSLLSTHTAVLLLRSGPLPTAPLSQPAAGTRLGPVHHWKRGRRPSRPQISPHYSERAWPGLRGDTSVLLVSFTNRSLPSLTWGVFRSLSHPHPTHLVLTSSRFSPRFFRAFQCRTARGTKNETALTSLHRSNENHVALADLTGMG